MSERTGTTIVCDRWECEDSVYGVTRKEARATADRRGWTRTEDGRDFCRPCTEIRAARTPVRALVPDGVRLMEPFDAAAAAGFERRDYDENEGTARFYHCGQEVDVTSLIGTPYYAKCRVCEVAIGDVLGPSFSRTGSAVSLPDSDKVDTEDPCSWVVVSEYDAAAAVRSGA